MHGLSAGRITIPMSLSNLLKHRFNNAAFTRNTESRNYTGYNMK